MPMYNSKCPTCGATKEEFRPLAQWGQQPTCDCGTIMETDLATQVSAVRGSYKHPIVSDSMGFLATSEDVAEHRSRFPNIELDIDNGTARPIFRSLTQKRKYLQANNWVDTRSF
jgi:hypothetical protein